MNGHFVTCDICGAIGHKAASCGLNKLEARRDPFGEQSRRQSYRRRRDEFRAKVLPGSALANVQSSPRFGA
jgi:hypothetical protein